MWLMSCPTQCLPSASDSYANHNRGFASSAFVQQNSGPNFLGLSADIVSMLHRVPMLDCWSLCSCGAFSFALLPRLYGLTNRSLLVKLYLSLRDHYMVTLTLGGLSTESSSRRKQTIGDLNDGPYNVTRRAVRAPRSTLWPKAMAYRDKAPSTQVMKTVLLAWVNQ